MSDKIRVDVSELTLGEMAEAAELAGDTDAPGGSFRNLAAMAAIVKRRTEPTYTYEDALRLTMGELEIVEAPPEADAGDSGVPPLSSAEHGASIRAS